MAPPLLPIAVLALGSAGAGPTPALPPPVPGLYVGTTDQGSRVSVRVREGGRASWRIAYRGECTDGARIRGGYRSGDGTPEASFDRAGAFRVEAEEPAPFKGGAAGTARFELSGRLGPEGGSGTWRIEVVPPRPGGQAVTCTSGTVRWGVARG